MRIKTALYNTDHLEYGIVTIPFPIPKDQYDSTIKMLEAFDIGDPRERDCMVREVLGPVPSLKCLEGTQINVDELDYLVKRLDSFSDDEIAQFQAMAFKLGKLNMTGLINLTFCCQEATVITDFSDLEGIGRAHYMNLYGGGASISPDNPGGTSLGILRELLIDMGWIWEGYDPISETEMPWDEFLTQYMGSFDEAVEQARHTGNAPGIAPETKEQIFYGIGIHMRELTESCGNREQVRQWMSLAEQMNEEWAGTTQYPLFYQMINGPLWEGEMFKKPIIHLPYGYLPPKTKAIVDEIVDELAKDERVAAAYDLWYQMQEEICRTYSEQPPRRVPLSQQKEFKAVRNMVIQEALRLSQTESISEDLLQGRAEIPNASEPPNDQPDGNQAETTKKDDSIPPVAPERSKPSEQEKRPAVAAAVSRMFYHMGRIFEDRCLTDAMQRGLQIDRKRRWQLLEKKMAMGHKADDHENEEIQMK